MADHEYFLKLCINHARKSNDPSTRVGALIVSPRNGIISYGFNCFPIGIAETDERLNDREVKLSLTVHAEMNAILFAAKKGISTKNCTLYLIAKDARGPNIWGGPPCFRCVTEIIQTGITEIVSVIERKIPSRWAEDLILAEMVLKEAGVRFTEISFA